jgi:tetratricopeptide (TPR) repeat protein
VSRKMSLSLLSLVATIFLFAGAALGATEKPTTNVQRPSRGRVIGFIRDARTRQPLEGVTVAVQEDGTFAREGKTLGASDAHGRFQAEACLGKVSSRLDLMRLLTTHWITLLLQPSSVTKQTRTIDLSQVNVKAEKPGYKPFLGAVRCERVDPGAFAVHLDDILLAPEGSDLASFSPDNVRYEVIQSFTVEPAVARPGEKVTVTLRAQFPVERGGKYRAFVDSSSLKLVRPGAELKPVGKPDSGTGAMTFARTFLLPDKPKENATELTFFLIRDYQEVPVDGEWKALLQVVNTDAERQAAERVDEGFRLASAGEQGQAVEKYREAAAADPEYAPAHQYLGDACLCLNRADEAAASFQKLIALFPDDWEVAHPRYALALLQSGRPAMAAKELTGVESKMKRVPYQVYLYRARSFADLGDFKAADADLTKAGRRMRIPADVRDEINMKRAEAAVKESPDSVDAHLGLARSLSDAHRWEEAALEIRKGLALDPNQPWAQVELGVALRQLNRPDEAVAAFNEALRLDPNNVEAHLELANTYRSREQYAEALPHYQFVVQQRKTHFEARLNEALMYYQTGQMDEAVASFGEALKLARGKGELKTGLEIPLGYTALYFGPKKRLIAGFANDEAAQDYLILDSLDALKKNPQDGLAWLNIGTALVRLKLPSMALSALAKAAALQPDLIETKYWAAMAHRQVGRNEEARQELEEVLKANPMHPHAHLELAQLLAEAGETEQAQTHVLAHARNWPNERRVASR